MALCTPSSMALLVVSRQRNLQGEYLPVSESMSANAQSIGASESSCCAEETG
jgi:hypothetical protein